MLIHSPLKLRGSSGSAQEAGKASKWFSFSPFPRRGGLKKNVKVDSEKKIEQRTSISILIMLGFSYDTLFN